MPKTNPPHSDNKLIDQAGELPTPSQGGRSGGDMARQLGTRAELHASRGGAPSVERKTGNDDPDADAVKGPKTQAEFRKRK